MATINKTFRYEVLDSAGTYLGDLNDVYGDPKFTQDMNSGGAQMVITRGVNPLSFSEGTLVNFRNRVNVYAVDTEAPNGTKIFTGFISAYRPVIMTEKNYVEITILSYGAELSQFILSSVNAADVSQTSQDTAVAIGGITAAEQSWITGASVSNLTRIDLRLDTASATVPTTLTISIYQDDGTNNPNSASFVGSAAIILAAGTAAAVQSFFFSSITLFPSTRYWMQVTRGGAVGVAANIYVKNSDIYANGTFATYNGTTWVTATQDAYFVTYASTGSTQYVFTATDVGTMFQQIMDSYIGQGGVLTYTAGVSVETTGQTVSYTFNVSSILDALNKCVDLAPPGWYWYVDQTTNLVHFHQKSHDATQTFTLGKDLSSINLEKTLDKTINTIYMTGGPTAGVNLFRKYVSTSSVAKYGQLLLNYYDSNITGSAAADLIGKTLLGNLSAPTIRSELEILDSAAGGFDIEVLHVGLIINIAGIPGSGSTISLWDVSQWDVDYWDFNIQDLQSINMQITRFIYTPGKATIEVQVIPPQITNQAASISKGLAQQQNLNNPAVPTSVSI